MNQRPKLGRPYGRKQFREPRGVKYARRYLELWAGEGLTPTVAAMKVAAEWRISPPDVFHAYKRHLGRLLLDRANYVWFGRWLIRYHPDVADAFARRCVLEFQSGFDKLATRLDALGNIAGAQAARAFDPANIIASEAWLALLGLIYLEYLKP